jgi:predicted metalloprotease with PDZ domain
MRRPLALALALALAGPPAAAPAQHPLRHHVDAVEVRYARSQPVVSYVLRVDGADLSGFEVEMRLRNVPDTVRLAMAAHPEYDDRFWRYVEGLRVEGAPPAAVARLDSAVWRIAAPGGQAVVRYRIRLPERQPGERAAWRPFLSPTGGLVGGPHSFMYVLGANLAPSHVRLELPDGWEIATGLTPTSDPRTFFAPSAEVLMESPVLAGRLRSWGFAVDGVPHRVVYWPAPGAAPFDTAAFAGQVERLVRQAVDLFGRAPYREYLFLFQDSAWGGLEHPNSVTLGAPSARLAEDVSSVLGETAHEFVHTWNLMRIRPEEYGPVDYRTQRPTAGLWFSEGLTMFYADLLLRRAGLPVEDSTRVAHLEGLIARYLASPGNARFSAEQVSRVAYNAPPGALGDYTASAHLQGELIGAMLDLVVRHATAGRRSMDDVMRLMLERFSGERGFNGQGVEQAVEEVCGCDVTPFFDAHVRGAGAIDFDRWLRLAGLRTRVSWTPALNREGRPAVDLRIWGRELPGGQGLSLVVSDPASAWGRAGLHTGDRLVSIDGAAVRTWPELRAVLTRATIGDTLRFEVAREGGPFRTAVAVSGFNRPVVRIEEVPDAGARERGVREAWLRGR